VNFFTFQQSTAKKRMYYAPYGVTPLGKFLSTISNSFLQEALGRGKRKGDVGKGIHNLLELCMEKTMQTTHRILHRVGSQHTLLGFLVTLSMLLFTLFFTACGNTGGTTTGTASAAGSVHTSATRGSTTVSGAAGTGNSSVASSAGNIPAKTLQFIRIRMVTPALGWGLTASAVFTTADGGKSWSPAGELPSAQLKVVAGEFLNARFAWIVVRAVAPASANLNPIQVLRTVDGGRNWQPASTPLSTSASDSPGTPNFVNTQDGWIEVVTNGGPGAGSESVDIFRTTDGGDVWKKVASTDGPSGLSREGIKSGISFKDAQNGWATASTASSTPWLYVTHNGGSNWQRQALPGVKPNSSYLTTPPVFFGTQGILPVSVSLQNGTGTAIYTTTNGGKTWNAPQALAPFDLMSTDSIYVADTAHAWAINRNGQLSATTSANWQQWHLLAGNAAQYKLTQMSFVNASDGWAIGTVNGTKTLVDTTDGGHTWKQE